MEFLIEFWDYEKSPYIRELHLRGKSFHKNHSNRITRIIFNSDIEYCICDEAAVGNNRNLISFNRREA